MKRRSILTIGTFLAMTFLATLLGACGGGGSDSLSYTVTLVNVGSNQPLAPPALVVHDGEYTPWTVGEAASDGLELLAEAGDTSIFLQEAGMDADFVMATAGTGVIPPGAFREFDLSLTAETGTELAVATMLVNTNDAFAGKADLDLSAIGVGQTVSALVPIWDAGTEPNSETAATVPGPAGGGEGFNDDRTGDRNFVTVHPGVLTADEGLAASALDESHRFAGPVLLVKIHRDQ